MKFSGLTTLVGVANYIVAHGWRRRGALVFEAGDVADDREWLILVKRPMSDVLNLGKKFRGLIPMFSCLPSDAEQTSITSRHRQC